MVFIKKEEGLKNGVTECNITLFFSKPFGVSNFILSFAFFDDLRHFLCHIATNFTHVLFFV